MERQLAATISDIAVGLTKDALHPAALEMTVRVSNESVVERWLPSRPTSEVTDLPESGMNARDQSLLAGDAGEQIGQQLAFGLAQRLAEITVVGARDSTDTAHHRFAVLGQVQGVLPSVCAAALTTDKTAPFQVVDEGDDAAGQQLEPDGDLLLTTARLTGDGAEHTGQRWGELCLSDTLGEPGSGMGTKLGK